MLRSGKPRSDRRSTMAYPPRPRVRALENRRERRVDRIYLRQIPDRLKSR